MGTRARRVMTSPVGSAANRGPVDAVQREAWQRLAEAVEPSPTCSCMTFGCPDCYRHSEARRVWNGGQRRLVKAVPALLAEVERAEFERDDWKSLYMLAVEEGQKQIGLRDEARAALADAVRQARLDVLDEAITAVQEFNDGHPYSNRRMVTDGLVELRRKVESE